MGKNEDKAPETGAEKNRRKEMWERVSFILELLLCFGVVTLFSACPSAEDGTYMPCHNVQMNIFYLGISMMVLDALSIFRNDIRVSMIASALNMVLSSMVFMLPGILMGLCTGQGERCHVFMQPFVRFCGIVILISNAFAFFSVLQQKKSRDGGE